MLDLAIRRRTGAFALDVAITLEKGVLGLVGPSGSGKTTTLQAIAGLARPDSGHIRFEGETWFDETSGIWLPAHRRGVGYVFQEPRLFPHLSVARNLGYGRWMRGLPRDAAENRRIVTMLDIGHLLDRAPRNLSGGEAQRVAIGRALLARPRLMLLDEPMASLDSARKLEILPYLERLRDQTRIPMIYVSHNEDEIARIASPVLHLEDGRAAA